MVGALGGPPVRAVSQRFLDALNTSHRRSTAVTATIPGGTTVDLDWEAGSITAASGTGQRYSAELTVTPKPGQATAALLGTPGTIVRIEHGVDFGAGQIERVPVFTGEVASSPSVSIIGDSISLSLSDQWKRIERCRFLAPFTPPAATRAATIAAAVTAAIPGVEILILDDGGTHSGGTTWDRDRTQLIQDLARDGGLEAGFDAAGVFVIRKAPTPTAGGDAVWELKTGSESNILTAEREIPLDRLYNTVVVSPSTEDQTWPAQVVDNLPVSHPRHKSKIGVVPYFWASPTITSGAAANAAGVTLLARVVGEAGTVKVSALGNPALEPCDVVSVYHSATATDPGMSETHFADSIAIDLRNYSMELATRTVPIEEEA